MSKCIVSLGWRTTFVMDSDKAITLLELISTCEVYESVYHPSEGDKKSFNTHHVYPLDDGSTAKVELLPTNIYNVAKLAGKPEKK